MVETSHLSIFALVNFCCLSDRQNLKTDMKNFAAFMFHQYWFNKKFFWMGKCSNLQYIQSYIYYILYVIIYLYFV